MVNYLSLINHQGRLFINPPVPENDGLLAVIDFKHKNKTYYPVDLSFNGVGDAFLVSDSRGQVTLFQLANNRYMVINESPRNPVAGVTFTGKNPTDQVFIAYKDKTVETHSLNGKLLDKFNQSHQLEVKNLDLNVKMNLLLSQSPDSCHLWTTCNSNSVTKCKSLFAKDGVHFTQARFSPDGQSIVTLLKDGDIIQWSLDTAMRLDSQSLSLNNKTAQVTCFDLGIHYLVAGGKELPYLIVKDLQSSWKTEEYFKLPVGCRGIEKMALLRDKSLLAFISEGYFYLVDVSSKQIDGRIRGKINIRIPNESIKNFDVDFNMNTVLLATVNGNLYIYDLPKALENERILTKKKIQMGVEEDLVVTFLEPANQEEVSINLGKSLNHLKSTITEENKLASFLQPLVTNEQRTLSQNDYIVQDSMRTLNNPFVQKSLMEAQHHTLSQQNFSHIGSQMMSIQSQGYTIAPEKQEYLNAGLSTTLANKSNLQKSSASIVKSTMSYKPNKSTLRDNTKSIITQKSQISHQPMQSQYRLDEDYQPDFKFTKSTMNCSQMAQFNMPKLRQMLKQFGEYPEKYRFLTWKYLLDLPLNKDSFSVLMKRGIHPVFKFLHKKYPIQEHRLYNKLVRTLSSLGNWSPIFLDVDYLPSIVFPFIKVIPNDDLMVFELVMALIVQYMQTWFEGYPSEPLTVLNAVSEIIDKESPQLSLHLKQNALTPQVYAWPLLKTFFTEVLSKEDWLRLIDHLFTYREDPELIIYFCAAFLISSKGAIQSLTSIEELHNFQSTNIGISFKKIMNLAFKLHGKYSQVLFSGHISNNLPLVKPGFSEYPSFTRYPEQTIHTQARMKERIILEEEELIKKQQLLEELRIKQEQILVNEELLRKQQEAALQAEVERKKRLQQEQEMMLQQRIRLDEMTRLAKLEHIKKIEEAMMSALQRQENLKKEEDKVAAEELIQRQRLAQYEYEARLQDEAINNMEFKANQKLLEIMQKQQSEEQIRKMKQDFELRQKEEEHRDRMIQEKWRSEDQEQRIKNELIRQTLQQQTQQMQQLSEKQKLEEMMRLQEHEKELQLLQIEEQRRLRALEEEQILKKQQFLEEMRVKGEMKSQMEQDRMWQKLIEEREIEKERVRRRMEDIERERYRLEEAIEREREQRERYEEVQRYPRSDRENMSHLSQMSEQKRYNAEQMQKQLQQEREEAERRRVDMMKKEVQMRDQDNLMQFIKQTETNINNIVDKGQKELEERRLSRGFNTGQQQQQPSEHYQNLRMKESYESKIQERERQLKEQNDMLARRLAEEKENYNLQYQQQQYSNPYEVNAKYGHEQMSSSQSSQSYHDSSSLMSSQKDEDVIKRHYQLKSEIQNYNQTFKNQQVFDYNPQVMNPPVQLEGQQISSQQRYEVKSKKHKHPKASSRSKDDQSYYDSSSSSADSSDDDNSLTSSNSAFSGTLNSGRDPKGTNSQINPYQASNGMNTNESYSSYSSSSQLSSMVSQNRQQQIYNDVRFAGAQGTINPYLQGMQVTHHYR